MTQPQPAGLRFAAGTRERGVGSMTGVLLCTDREDVGALNLSSHRPGTFSKECETPAGCWPPTPPWPAPAPSSLAMSWPMQLKPSTSAFVHG
ncbi:hypothetical protein [Streptomyces sp. NPDC046759]|uniref:hypothetical protein n=1 Tax=Streptomyces sp. NPDC046759 TaxID=3155019 RepID=UPI00340CBBCA